MSIIDEFKRWTHPYEDEDEEYEDDFPEIQRKESPFEERRSRAEQYMRFQISWHLYCL